jgi:hypothetical protein
MMPRRRLAPCGIRMAAAHAIYAAEPWISEPAATSGGLTILPKRVVSISTDLTDAERATLQAAPNVTLATIPGAVFLQPDEPPQQTAAVIATAMSAARN